MKKIFLTTMCVIGLTFCIAQSGFLPASGGTSTASMNVNSPPTSILKPALLVEDSKRAGFSFTERHFFNRSNTHYNQNIRHREVVRNASLLDINLAQVRSFRMSNDPTFTLSLPLNSGNEIELELVEVNIFTDDFIVATDLHPEGVDVDLGKHYRGVVKGVEGSVAALSVFDGEIAAVFSTPEDGNFVLGKLENQLSRKRGTQHILYKDRDMLVSNDFECKTVGEGRGYTREELPVEESRALTDCVRFYYEAENDISQNKGGQQGATNYITAMHNQVAALYANENINTRVSQIFVWTNADPYNSNDTEALLNQFGNNRPNFNGDLAMLLTFRDVGGGIAWIDVLCGAPPYSVSGIDDNFQNIPTYSWTIGVVAHEFGHNFGSPHTHACAWNGNNTAIDGCFNTEGGCPSPGFPNGGGTVMSYCHLTGVGINLANGFGPQPGNLMRNRVQNANCLQACDNNNNEPDFTITALTFPTPVQAGVSTTGSVTLANQGNANYTGGNSTTRMFLSTNNSLDNNDTELWTSATPALNAGQNLTIGYNTIIPNGTPDGNYYLIMHIDNNDAVAESNEGNNVRATNLVTVGNPPTGLNCDNAATVSCGQTINGSTIGQPSDNNEYCGSDPNYTGPEEVYRLNWGGGPVNISLTNLNADVDLLLLPDCNNTNCVEFSDQGGTANELISLNNLNAGTYYIVIDGWQGAQSSFTLSIENCGGGGDQPDYTVTNLSTNNNNVAPGSSFAMSLTIQNIGNANGNGNGGKDRFYLSTNSTFDGGDIQIGEGQTGSLNAGANFNVNGNVTIPGNTPNGNYFILFFIDSDNQVNESNENNNVDSYPITVGNGGGQPDYVAQFTGGPNTANAGQTITLTSQITNQGNANGNSTSLSRYYLSTDQSFGGSDLFLNQPGADGTPGIENHPIINAGQSINETEDLIIPASVGNGTYYVLMVVDYNNEINESNENNNVASKQITIGNGGGNQPDYTVTNLSTNNNNVAPGSSFSMSLTIQNIGNANGNGNGGKDRFYLSTNSTYDGGDIQIGEGQTGSLNAGASFNVNGNVTIPGNTPNGNYFILFFIDSDNQVTESNENNNVDSYPITVGNGGGNPPTANFTANKTNPCVGEVVQFSSTSTGNPTSYNWSFPGGTPSSSTSPNPTVTYANTGSYNVSLLVSNNNGSDAETKTNYISVQTCGGNGPDWPVTQTGDNHTVIIQSNTTITFNGQPIQNGDYIGAFFDDNGTLKCAGKSAWTGGNISVTVYGDDQTTGVKEGFNPGETFQWKLWKSSSDEEINATATYLPPNGVITHTSQYVTDGISQIISLIGSSQQTQTISMSPGWNMISSYVVPIDGNIESIFNSIKNNIALVKNGTGDIYFPSSSINTIGNWNIVDGYQVRVIGNAPINLQITGQKVNPATTPISLTTGWNLFAYLRDTEQSIVTTLQPVQTNLIIVKNGAGQVYFPSLAINNIGNMKPGEGYQAKVSSNSILSYNMRMATPPANTHQANLTPGHYNIEQPKNGGNASLILKANDILDYGDEVGIFNERGLLVGAMVYEGFPMAFPIWGDETATPEVEGLVENEEFELRVWRKEINQEEVLHATFELGANTYQTDGILIGNLQRTTNIQSGTLVTNSLNIYPNPAQSSTKLALELNKSAQVNASIYDVRGKLMSRVADKKISAGKHEFDIISTNLPEGIYHCRVMIDGVSHNLSFAVMK